MKKTNSKLVTREQVDAMITAFQLLLLDISNELLNVAPALEKLTNKQLLHKNAQKEIIRSNKKSKK